MYYQLKKYFEFDELSKEQQEILINQYREQMPKCFPEDNEETWNNEEIIKQVFIDNSLFDEELNSIESNKSCRVESPKLLFNLREFDQLESSEKDKLHNKFMENFDNENPRWYRDVFGMQTETINNIGFDDIKIYFSGFWSQGDGAMFECKAFDFKQYLKENKSLYSKLPKDFLEQIELGNITVDYTVTHKGHYYHERCSHRVFELNNYSDLEVSEDLQYDIEQHIEQTYFSLCEKTYVLLKLEYENLTSFEQMSEYYQDCFLFTDSLKIIPWNDNKIINLLK